MALGLGPVSNRKESTHSRLHPGVRRSRELRRELVRSAAYLVLGLLLSLIYAAVWLVSYTLLQGFGLNSLVWPGLPASISVGLALSPVRWTLQLFIARRFGPWLGIEAFLIFESRSRLKRIEEQLRRSDLLSDLGTLSASLAHEIKNPLVAIKTFVQLLPEKQADADFLRRFSTLIGSEVNRIDSIVSQVLSLSRTSETYFEKVRLHSVLENTLQLLQHELTRKNIALVKDLRASDDSVWADRQKLEQIILNVVLNAQEAMPEGGELTIRTHLTRFSEGNGGSEPGNGAVKRELLLAFDDNGPGFSEEIRQKMFDPFFTTKETGTGLGLSIVYGILSEHGGTIDIANRPEGGASVQIRLPGYSDGATTEPKP